MHIQCEGYESKVHFCQTFYMCSNGTALQKGNNTM